jgi:hypothetical protein
MDVFKHIHRNNVWGSRESVSGPGSTSEQTRRLSAGFDAAVTELGVKTICDVACGDFEWLSRTDASRIVVSASDVVPSLVERNRTRYPGVHFDIRDVCDESSAGAMPCVDMALARDVFVHLPLDAIFRAIRNIRKSGARYIATTTFINRENSDILTGEWRPLCMLAPPFSWPPPDVLISERCTEQYPAYMDKSLGIWKLSAIPLQ